MALAEAYCPICGNRSGGTPATCPRCEAELAGYWRTCFRPWLCYNMAVELAQAGNVAGAARAAEAAVAIDPSRFEFHLLLARLLGSLGETAPAIRHAQDALEISPDSKAAEALLEALFEIRFPPAAPGQQAPDGGGEVISY